MNRRDLLAKLSERSLSLLETAGRISEERGESAYLVGGSVRDLILDRGEMDLDVVVEGDGMAVAQALARATGATLTRYHAFQTARVDTPEEIRVDVATARRETYPHPGLLPQVVAGTVGEDLERRDFTINTMAIALNPASWGSLFDPEGGIDDLRTGLVRVLHSRSFADDPTRILRALRFVERFGYLLEERTAMQLREAVAGGYLEYVSGARVRRELGYFLSEAPVEGPIVLQEHGVLSAIDDQLRAERQQLEALAENRAWYAAVAARHGAGDAAGATGSVLSEARLENHAFVDPCWSLVLALCAGTLAGQERWKLAGHLGLTRSEREPLIQSGPAWNRVLQEWGGRDENERRDPLVADAIFSSLAVTTLLVQLSGPAVMDDRELEAAIRGFLADTQWQKPALRGRDLIELGVPQGPSVGQLLDLLRQGRVAGTLVDENDERDLVRGWLTRQNGAFQRGD